MRFNIEEEKEKDKVLFVYKKKPKLIDELVKKITSYGYSIFHSEKLSSSDNNYKFIFILDQKPVLNIYDLKNYPRGTILLTFLKKRPLSQVDPSIQKHIAKQGIKIINLNPNTSDQNVVEKIIWFCLSKTEEFVLDLYSPIEKESARKNKSRFFFSEGSKIRKRYLILLSVFIFFIIETFFLIPLFISTFFIYSGYRNTTDNNMLSANRNLNIAEQFINITDASYKIARPGLSLFFLTLTTDNIVAMPRLGWELLQTATQTSQNLKEIITLVLDKNPDMQKANLIKGRFSTLNTQLDQLSNLSEQISNKSDLPLGVFKELDEKISAVSQDISKIKQISENIDSLIGGQGQKKYLVLFQNNMEIRPGGGFIGSFAILTFENYHLKDIYLEDVYEADGQLKAHIEPPIPIRKYLQQPHWFLRDSNFSPDFEENFNQAEFFLQKELDTPEFDGGAAITTTAISYLLKSFGSVYVSDYNETITADNFYIKTQTHSEKDFFPGSKQKKNFLSSVVDSMTANLQNAPVRQVSQNIKKALDEKQIVLHFKDPQIQKIIESMGYSGSVIVPNCPQETKDCIADTLLAVDANLGVNKANFFLNRIMNLKVNIGPSGEINNIFTINFINNSQSDTFPGGYYKNYFQLYLPKDVTIEKVFYNSKEISTAQINQQDQFTTVSYYLEIPPKNSAVLQVNYTLLKKLDLGKNLYQLILQKQIGSDNNDFVMELNVAKNISVTDNNFAALAKEGGMIYNTSLSNDRIFFIELNRN